MEAIQPALGMTGAMTWGTAGLVSSLVVRGSVS
jgi:hypothetical protein